MLRAFAPNGEGTLVRVDGDGSDSGAPWVWVDVMPDDGSEVEALGRRFGLNRHAVEDATTDTHFPKLDDFEDHLFAVLHGITEMGGRIDTTEIDLFLGRNFLITVHRIPSPSVEWVVQNAAKDASGPDVMFARLVDASSRRLLPLIDALDDEIDDLEERAIYGDGSVVPEIQALRRDAIRLKRVIGPQRDVLRSLSGRHVSLIGDRARMRFRSAHDHVLRVVENLDSSRILLSSVLESYRGAVAERMNEVMKVLTVYAAILLPLTLMAGIYGMNFSNIPELEWRWGYFALLGLMATVAIGQWVYFARRGFVGSFSFRRIPRTLGRGLVRLASLPLDVVAAAVGDRDRRPRESGVGFEADDVD